MSYEELTMKRRALNMIRLDIAKKGISADPYLRIEEEDLVAEIRAIEHELGIAQTPTLQERRQRAAPARYVPPPVPEPVFRERIAGEQMNARQADITHQMGLLKIHRSNMAHYRAQARAFGGIDLAPPMTRNGMAEQRERIAQIKSTLRGYGVEIDDLAGDE